MVFTLKYHRPLTKLWEFLRFNMRFQKRTCFIHQTNALSDQPADSFLNLQDAFGGMIMLPLPWMRKYAAEQAE